MTTSSRWLVALAAMAMTVVLPSTPLLARGGAASIMNSPGYQRRLQESRQQLPDVKPSPPPTHHHRKPPRREPAASHASPG